MPGKVNTKTQFEGTISRVLFYDEVREELPSIFKVITDTGETETVLASGLEDPAEGIRVRVEGRWVANPRNPAEVQCKASSVMESVVFSSMGVIDWISSGAIREFSLKKSREVASKMAESKLDWSSILMSPSITIPTGVEIDDDTISMMQKYWIRNINIQKLADVIADYDVTFGMAKGVYDHFIKKNQQTMDSTINKIRSNPYLLSRVSGISFNTLDKVLSKTLGNTFIGRIHAGLIYTMERRIANGDTCAPIEKYVNEASENLNITQESMRKVVAKFVMEDSKDKTFESVTIDTQEYITLRSISSSEKVISAAMSMLLGQKVVPVKWKSPEFELDESQKSALNVMSEAPVSLLIGGPGRGKTTMLKTIAEAANDAGYQVIMCAPTGRAAQRMQESTGFKATTVHKLLREMEYDNVNIKKKSWIFVDESSMMDVRLMGRLSHQILTKSALCAGLTIPLRLTLVGDKDQLLPIDIGSVLHDCMKSGVIPIAELTTMHRAAHGSGIHMLGDDILNGRIKDVDSYEDVSMVPTQQFMSEGVPAKAFSSFVKELVDETGKEYQIICPVHDNPLGVYNINKAIRDVFNPEDLLKPCLIGGKWRFREGDKVIQTENNAELEVFNGEIGKIESINFNAGKDPNMIVKFDNKEVSYSKDDVKSLDMAYCITVHKSQGSQFDGVIMVVPKASYFVNLNMVYTGITRGKSSVIVVSDKDTWTRSCKTTAHERCTLLSGMIRSDVAGKATQVAEGSMDM